jgi:hypothetical protein
MGLPGIAPLGLSAGNTARPSRGTWRGQGWVFRLTYLEAHYNGLTVIYRTGTYRTGIYRAGPCRPSIYRWMFRQPREPLLCQHRRPSA